MTAPSHVSKVFHSPIVGVWATSSASSVHFDRHWHDSYSFGLLDRGGQRWRSWRGSVDAYPGQVINTNPGEVHDGQPLGGPTRHWRIVSVDAEAMRTLLDRTTDQGEITFPVIDDPVLVAALERLLESIEGWTRGGRTTLAALSVEEALVESCVLLISRHGSAPLHVFRSGSDVTVVRDRLEDEWLHAPTLAELAAMTGLSKYQVLRAFQKKYGLSPQRWLLCKRAERARALISGGASLAGAAAESGFTDQSHMTRTFARMYGYTPGAWQRATAPAAQSAREAPG